MIEDEWVKAAFSDDYLVAELLMRLNKAEEHASPTVKRLAAVPPLGWGVRQPRSKQVVRCNIVQAKKEGESSTRASPTTPLSWSGGKSFSGGAADDGCEESSKPAKRPSGGRSKVTPTNENTTATTTITTTRRSRRKKTFAELKEEESLLLKERTHLKRELAALRITLEEQRTRNENLKRRKLDLQNQSANKAVTPKEPLCDGPQHIESVSVVDTPTGEPTTAPPNELDAAVCSSPPSESHEVRNKDVCSRESLFVLPDLNLPLEDDSGPEDLYGMS
ncbi:PREDICTED: uncharacterized protein LOC104603379 [Nelumbo nucifera]|uniref:Uncharacterized protein LOC104603379 n=1 Tax=Nelumbo nucifera TaxID=4432 RepID=A0A1U8AF85_NELNU|nr:PREDICTED: uncharacterized protein LOC104603379 [Nelumbo nucifera]